MTIMRSSLVDMISEGKKKRLDECGPTLETQEEMLERRSLRVVTELDRCIYIASPKHSAKMCVIVLGGIINEQQDDAGLSSRRGRGGVTEARLS
jgi:hypothetical protein